MVFKSYILCNFACFIVRWIFGAVTYTFFQNFFHELVVRSGQTCGHFWFCATLFANLSVFNKRLKQQRTISNNTIVFVCIAEEKRICHVLSTVMGQKTCMLNCPLNHTRILQQQWLWRDCADGDWGDAQAGLSIRWSHMQ